MLHLLPDRSHYWYESVGKTERLGLTCVAANADHVWFDRKGMTVCIKHAMVSVEVAKDNALQAFDRMTYLLEMSEEWRVDGWEADDDLFELCPHIRETIGRAIFSALRGASSIKEEIFEPGYGFNTILHSLDKSIDLDCQVLGAIYRELEGLWPPSVQMVSSGHGSYLDLRD